MSDVNTAAEQQESPISALYPYLEHRKPECKEACVCGAREAVRRRVVRIARLGDCAGARDYSTLAMAQVQ